MTHQSQPLFPVLDAPRTRATAEVGRVVVDHLGYVEPRIDETDDWCSMPLRLAHSQAAGWYLELGPYELDIADILRLREAIAAYDSAVGRARQGDAS